MNNKLTGKHIKQIREDYSLTQENLKELLNTSTSTIQKWEARPNKAIMKKYYDKIATIILTLNPNINFHTYLDGALVSSDKKSAETILIEKLMAHANHEEACVLAGLLEKTNIAI